MTEKRKEVSLAYQELSFIDPQMIPHPERVVRLDVSYNSFSDLMGFSEMKNLEILVLDGNKLKSHTRFPPLPHLHTLSVNKNEVSNLAIFCDRVRQASPSLKHFSLLQNAACPNFFNGGTLKQYRDYRLYVISRFPQLVMLDSSVVEDEEKRASKDIYGDILPPVKKDRDELGQEPRDRRRKKKKGGEPRRRKEKMGGPSSSSSSLAKKEPATEQPQTKSLVDIQLPDLNEIELKKDIKKHPSTSTTKQHVETGGVMGGEEAEWEDDDSDWTDDELQLPKIDNDDDDDWDDDDE